MFRSHLVACLALASFVSTAPADEGMWLLNRPPVEALKGKYAFEPSAAWLDHMQKSCVRFETGGSGSIVSANGLVMTNHHVGSDMIEKLSTPERNLMETGFHARTRAEELPCPDLELRLLWSIEDVTERVNSAVGEGMAAADALAARRKMMSAIEAEAQEKTGLYAEVVTLYQGGRYHLYSSKRYTDVRLVFAPEMQIAFFGGDTDNFEYPRFDLDCCFFRIYENGQPLKATHHLKWSANGAADGELTFVFGHPGSTDRLYTVDHLKFMRDAELPYTLRRLWRNEIKMTSFAARSDEHARIASGDVFGIANSRKAQTGVLAGLLDPVIMDRKRADEQALRAAVQANSDQRTAWGDAWHEITEAQETLREFYVRYAALEFRGGALRGDLPRIARTLVRLAAEKAKPSADRLREYRDSELPSVELELFSPAPIYEALEIERLASGLSLMAELLGGDDPAVQAALGGLSPHNRAEQLVKATTLEDVEVRRRVAGGGQPTIDNARDPLLVLIRNLDAEARALRQRYEDEVESVERGAYARIAAAMFAIHGESIYPDATFTLRLAFGPIKGYAEHGAAVAPFTTFAGLYERSELRHAAYPFNLPQRWIDRKDRLELGTPFNFVCTADIIGGNSGSPVVNKAGEVVGLIFDGNVQSLVWDVAYTDAQGRAVAVDSRGMIEALGAVYEADELVNELTAK